jgi:Mg-chelatase subunit ChlD
MHRDCSGCGHPHRADEHACTHCGQSLDWVSATMRPRPWSARQTIGLGMVLGLALGWMQCRPVAEHTSRPQLDVVLAIDCTGSMADELDAIKYQLHSVLEKLNPAMFLRVGLVAYKDHGDEYVTKSQPLTADLPAILSCLKDLRASGGGDTPEAVDEALHTAVEELNWDSDPQTTRLLFLIGDAGPHPGSRYDVLTEARVASDRHIKIETIGCSGIESCGEQEFRDMASLSGGQFHYLTYHQRDMIYQVPQTYALHSGAAQSDWKLGGTTLTRRYGRPAVEPEPTEIPDNGNGLENNLDALILERIQAHF